MVKLEKTQSDDTSMTECPQCGKEISKKTALCPHCQSVLRKKRGGWIAAIVIALFIYLILLGSDSYFKYENDLASSIEERASERVISSIADKSTGEPVFQSPLPAKPAKVSFWRYASFNDSMTDEAIYQANISSSNSVNFSFPYNGEQNAELILRTHPRYGKDLMLSLDRAQFLCRHNGCNVLVRFDDNQPINYRASGTADGSTNTIFIIDYHGFVGKMLKSERVRISAEFYQQGSPTFGFDVMNFDTDKYLNQ